jgi:surfactin synthase thioesterase subunit
MNMKSLMRTRGRVASTIEDAAETVGDAVVRLSEEAREEFVDKVTKARRELADRIDPAPIPRRLRRWLVLGAVLGAAVAAAVVLWSRRSRRREDIFFDASENGQPPTEADGPDRSIDAGANSRNGGFTG